MFDAMTNLISDSTFRLINIERRTRNVEFRRHFISLVLLLSLGGCVFQYWMPMRLNVATGQ